MSGIFVRAPQCFLKELYLISFVLLYRLRIYSQRKKMFLVTVSSSLSRLPHPTGTGVVLRCRASEFRVQFTVGLLVGGFCGAEYHLSSKNLTNTQKLTSGWEMMPLSWKICTFTWTLIFPFLSSFQKRHYSNYILHVQNKD